MKNKIFKVIFVISILLQFSISYADDYIEDESFDFDYEELLQTSSDEAGITINSRIAVAFDRNSGRVIWGKNEDKKTAMASTTNPMATQTILLFLRDINAILR